MFLLLLCTVSATPVFAADEPTATTPDASPLASAEEEPPQIPDAEDVREGLEMAEQREAEREHWLAGPEAVRQREESRLAYADLSTAQAEALLGQVFAGQLAALNGDPARLLSGEQLIQPLDEDETVATVKSEGDGSVLDAGIPVRVESDEGGDLQKVDVSLEATAGGYETKNALSDVYIPGSAAEPIEIGEKGLSIIQVGADESREAHLFGDKTAYYHDVLSATGLMVAPIADGADLLSVLYSEESPETLRYDLELPAGAELRADGNGGAEILRDKEQLAYVPFPTAVDAQGTRVPVEMSLEGTTLVVHVAHREGDYALPILLDPAIHENYEGSWYWGDISSMGAWKYSTNDPTENYYVHNTYCLSAELCAPSGRGLYMLAYPDTYPANVYGHWWYYAPGGTSYIPSIYPEPSAAVNPFWRHNHNCTWEQHRWPYDYDGSFDQNGNWQWFSTDRAQWYGYDTMFTKAKGIAVGMSSGGNSGWTPCWRSIMLGGAAVRLDDPENPTLNYAYAPNGGEWVGKSGSVQISAWAQDPGLGVHTFWIHPQGKDMLQRTLGCSGTAVTPCSSSNAPTFNESSGLFDEGERTVEVSAMDPTAKYSGTQTFWVKVDRTPPTIALAGQLAKATDETEGDGRDDTGADELSLPIYNLTIEAKDGSKGSPAAKRSGVKNVEVFLDGNKMTVPWSPLPSCPETSCERKLTYPLQLTGLTAGSVHKVKVVAIDFLNEKEERTIEFEYVPATGMKEEYVLWHFPLPDGEDHDEEAVYHGPEIAVNVINGNVVYHERDVEVEGYAADLEVERFYNSMLPTSENTEWGDGWTLGQTPDLKPEGEAPASKASMVRTSGAIQRAVGLPTSTGGTRFDPELRATVTKEASGYAVEDATGAAPGEVVFDQSGRVEELRAGSYTEVDYDYEAGALSEIAVEDPIATTALPEEVAPEKAPSPSYQSAFGSTGAGNGQFSHPADVTLDLQGNLWIADKFNNRIQKFNSKGEFLTKYGSSGTALGQLGEPSSVAFDAKGDFWVAERANNRIQQFNASGVALKTVGSFGSANGQFNGPEGIAIDAKGNIWVSDTYNYRIQKFNDKGEFLGVVNPPGLGAIEPTGIDAGPGGNIWVADWAHNRVAVVNEAEGFVRSFGSAGSGAGQFAHPDAIDVDSRGNVWVGDESNGRIQQFSQAGEYLDQFGSQGSGAGQFSFSYPFGIATDNKGSIWIADANNNRVQKWKIPGYLPAYHSAFGSTGTGDGQFNRPADVALDSHGNLWVADQENHRIQQFDPSGEYLSRFGSSGTGDGQLNRPASLTIDAAGNIWVADKNNHRIQKFNAKGEYLAKFGSHGSANGQFNGPEGIAIDAKGNIWVSDTYNYRIQKFNDKGEFLGVVNPPGLGAIEPTGIDAGPGGNIWVTDWTNNRVVVLTEYGELVRQFGVAGTGPGQFNRPDAIDVDSQGNVWVGDQGNNRIQMFNQDGEYVLELGAPGSGAGQFSFAYPFGLVVGSKGRLWVADRNNNRVQRWEPADLAPTGEVLPVGDDPSVEINSEAGLVRSLAGEEAGSHGYAYSGDDLVSHDGPAGETTYQYDSAGRMTYVELPNGTKAMVAYYDDGRAKTVSVDPVGSEPAKTTKFEYSDAVGPEEARRTLVIPDGELAVTYEIGPDGSVFKWWNADEPPKITDLAGSLYVERETSSPIVPGDKSLLVEARSLEGLESIQFIANGNVLVDELRCEQTEAPGLECTEPIKNEWVVNTADLTPGILSLEAVATDRNGKTAAVRWWVNVPYTPPPDPEAEVPPKFADVLNFRKRYGLDLDLDPVADELELNDRIFDLIGAWHNPQTPLGEVARASWERWGVPLRPVDVAELEYRESYAEQAASVIPAYGQARPSTYAGYYIDHAAGGIIRVGFTSGAEAELNAIRPQLTAPASRVAAFPVPPSRTLAALESLEFTIASDSAADPNLRSLMTSLRVDSVAGKVVIGSDNPSAASSYVASHYGTIATRVESTPPPPPVPAAKYGRFNFEGPIQAGDEISSTAAGTCTAAYGASDIVNEGKPNEAKRFFLLTAGHCFPIGAEVTQAGGNTIGTMKRNHLDPNEVPTIDAGAILLDKAVSPPHHIFKSTQNQDPIEKPLTTFYPDQMVCQSGKRSGLRCGKVLNEGKPMLIVRRSDNGVRTQTWNIPIEVKVSRGDSGGPIFDRKTGRPMGITASAANGSEDSADPFYGIRPCRYFPEEGFEQYSCPIIGVQPLRSVVNPGNGTAVGVLDALGLTFFHD